MMSTQIIGKRAIDVATASILFVPAVASFAIVGLLIKLETPGPIFFRQKRLGRQDHPFWMLKFRTMTVDADQRQREFKHQNEADGFLFKMTNDPRETSFGRYLRRTGLDELPQIWNVLKGEMSIVGPRPLPIEDVNTERLLQEEPSLYLQWQVRKVVKPGITGLWQMQKSDRYAFKEMLSLDEKYVERYSLGLDLKIIALTVGRILQGMLPRRVVRYREWLGFGRSELDSDV